MRLLLMTPSYPPVLGGVQFVTHSLAKGLIARGHSVQVVTKRYPRRLVAAEVIESVRVRRMLFGAAGEALRRRRPDLLAASIYCSISGLIRMAQLVLNFRPETINLHFPGAEMSTILFLRKHFAFRLVVSLHGHEIERWLTNGTFVARGAQLELLQRTLRSANAITACSRYLLDQAVRIDPSVESKGSVVYNGIDVKTFSDAVPYVQSCPYVFGWGRFSYEKGFDLLIRSFSELAQAHPDLTLILAGEGREGAALRELTEELGLVGRVHFYGRATASEVASLLRGCRLAVIPSRQEAFGVVALEALASGRPLVATRVGGLPEIAATIGAPMILAEPHVADLVRAISTAMSLAAPSQPLIETFSESQMLSRYERVLDPSHNNVPIECL